MTRVLIAVDGTETAVHAARTATRLFGVGTDYLAVNVAGPTISDAERAGWSLGAAYAAPFGAVWTYTPPPSVVDAGDEPSSPAEQLAHQRAEEAAQLAGVPDAEVVAATGDPAQAILEAAEVHHADVIVVGSGDRPWFSRLLDPSVSREVLKDAEVPVLVVR
jgi:nucleotide-binding universal stress UspA family protein